MNQILRCDWLPERARWSYLARSGLPAVSRKKNFPERHIINPLLTKLVRSRWLDIGLVCFSSSLWTSTPSRSINTQKKNLANIQPSWPHTWSITHMYLSTFSSHLGVRPNPPNHPWIRPRLITQFQKGSSGAWTLVTVWRTCSTTFWNYFNINLLFQY